jgi:hypothetical protein
MSLINDALKKAARQRAEEQADVALPAQSGRRKRIPRHGAPMTAQTMVLLAAGAVTLIVASVVITGILITGRLEPKTAAVAAPPQVTPAQKPPPVVVVQVPRPAEEPAAPVRQPIPQPPTAEPVAQAAPRAAPAPQPAAQPAAHVAAAEAPRTAAAPPPSRADQIQSFVDGLRVTGVRAAGPDSKALVDGHIYRLNDVLDRALGVRLVQVDNDHLTLVDSQGVTYIKSF